MIPRYTRPEMGRIWSDENRFRTWLAVEVAATETLAAAGMVPKDAAKAIREKADFRVAPEPTWFVVLDMRPEDVVLREAS